MQPTAKLVKVDWDDNAPITDQGDVGGCVGWTALDLMNNKVFANSRREATGTIRLLPNSQGLEFYKLATRKDGLAGTYPPDDTGSSGLGGAKALKADGYITTYTHGFSMSDFLSALQHQPVMVGTVWTQDMFTPDRYGAVSPTGDEVGGHEYGAFGYSPASGWIKFRNHWTDKWGDRGRFYMQSSHFASLLARGGDVTIPVPL